MTNRSSGMAAAALLLAAGSCIAATDGTVAVNRGVAAEAGEGGSAGPAQRNGLVDARAMLMFDYQVIPIPGNPSIDLAGVHLLNPVNDWLHLGFGVQGPLFRGEYGGFMAVDITAHAQRRLFGNVLANAGLSLGGGGGGRSVENSKVLSGTGGFVKAYAGLGYDFGSFTAGANIARMQFKDSLIDHTQLNVFVQLPFSYAIGPYARAGETLSSNDAARGTSGESTLTLGLDNLLQIDPEASNKSTIRIVDLQYSHYLTRDSYWFLHAGVGYQGLPLYNQVLGGFGHRIRLSPSIHATAQLGVGSGGYDPGSIDTGPGLLVQPKLSLEYRFDRDMGVSLSAGYLLAPRGSSRSHTIGAAFHYHLGGPGAPRRESGAASGVYRGYRVNVFAQSEFDVSYRGIDRSQIRMLTLQLDTVVGDHLYLPVQIGAAYNAYLGYPGYGEIAAGIGVQSRHDPRSRWQFFGQLLAGANVHGPIVKPGLGFQYGWTDRLAIHALAGMTRSARTEGRTFRADYLGLGLAYRFTVPGG